MSVAAPPPSAVPTRKPRKGLIAAITSVGVLLLASLVGIGLVLVNPGSASATEIVLEGAADPGANPFSTDPFAGAPNLPTATPAATPSASPSPSATPVPVSGATPGLYGGTQNNGSCDAAQMITFLQNNPDKAKAWVDALNSDPLLGWPAGQLAVADLGAYISSLTSVVLMSDTRVTNHGFSGGVATPFQAVLQAGTAVLVDSFGVPRSRCVCGNPLVLPVPLPASTPISGTPWAGFNPNAVVTITATPQAIAQLLLGNLQNPTAPFTVQVLPAPGQPAPTPTPAPSPTPTPTPTATAAPTPAPTATAAPQTPVAPPVGLVCSPPHPGTSAQITNTIVNNTTKTLDIFSYIDCDPGYIFSIAPGDTSTFWNDWPDQYWVATSGSDTAISTFQLTPGGVWTIN